MRQGRVGSKRGLKAENAKPAPWLDSHVHTRILAIILRRNLHVRTDRIGRSFDGSRRRRGGGVLGLEGAAKRCGLKSAAAAAHTRLRDERLNISPSFSQSQT